MPIKLNIRTSCAAAMMLVSATPVWAASLKAGTAKVEITPPPGHYLMGSGEVKATGTLDPLYARVLVLEAGEQRVALVTVDLCRVFQAPLLERLRSEVRASSGIFYLLMSATHTHSGPVIPLSEELPVDEMTRWQSAAVGKIARAVHEACSRAVEARVGTGYGTIDIGHNRRRINPDGSVTMFFANPNRIPTFPVDPTVSVLRVDAADGPLAILVNYACHPVVIMGKLAKYSADFPGVACATVERAFEGPPMCMFLQGAAGNLDTYYTGVAVEDDPPAKLQWTGERLGREAVRVAKGIRTETSSEATLDFAEELLPFRWRWGQGKFEEVMRKLNPPALLPYYLADVKPELRLPVATLLLSKRVAMLGVPGEAFVEFQMDWRARCPTQDCFFLGYANGFFSYLPTIQAATEGGHGGALWTRVEPGAGERMVDHGVVTVLKMMGRLQDTPTVPRGQAQAQVHRVWSSAR